MRVSAWPAVLTSRRGVSLDNGTNHGGTNNGITRGGRIQGADAILEAEPELPVISSFASEPLWRREVLIGLHAGQQYTECAQIYNPIHTEPSVAKAAGLPDMILHGSATKAMALMSVVDECLGGDADRVTRLTGQLRGMVLMDSSISVECLSHEIAGDEIRVAFRVLPSEAVLVVKEPA